MTRGQDNSAGRKAPCQGFEPSNTYLISDLGLSMKAGAVEGCFDCAAGRLEPIPQLNEIPDRGIMPHAGARTHWRRLRIGSFGTPAQSISGSPTGWFPS